MSTYLKHMGGYTYKQLKGKSFDEIQKLFDKEMKRVNTFVSMGSEVQENKEKKEEGREETAKGSRKKMRGRKRAGKEQQKESSKKQKVEEEKESEEVKEDDEVELKKLLVIKKDEDIAIDAIPLAIKLPVIIDYKLHKEGLLVHYELIRADGSSKRYSSMIRMLQGIDREDLEALWRIVKAKHGDIRPENKFERVLYRDLKVMFEPDIKSDIWRMLQGYRVTIWKLIDSSGVHFVRFDNLHVFMLVRKIYPHYTITITNMLNKKLQTDHQMKCVIKPAEVLETRVCTANVVRDKQLILLGLSDIGQFIEDVITKKIVYHLFDDEVEFLGCVFLSYLLALEITCSCFHDFIDKDLIDLVLPDVRRCACCVRETNKDAKDCQGGNKGRDKVDKGEKKGEQYLWFLAGCEDRVTEKDVQCSRNF
ncbi:hypothetical protein Tco_1133524 [Tanacetum coccineum]